jgi:hypothetical protein
MYQTCGEASETQYTEDVAGASHNVVYWTRGGASKT